MRTGRPPTPPIARFWQKVKKTENGCWRWTAYIDSDGYGRFYWQSGRTAGLAHQFSYAFFKAPLDPTLTVDHVCRNRWCVNPDHLRQISGYQNILIGEGASAVNARKTRCKRGHAFSSNNTRIASDGSRVCLICEKERVDKYRTKNPKAARLAAQRYRDRHGVYWSHSSNCYVKKSL